MKKFVTAPLVVLGGIVGEGNGLKILQGHLGTASHKNCVPKINKPPQTFLSFK